MKKFILKYKFIILLFIFTRVIYTIIGVYSFPSRQAFNIYPSDTHKYSTLPYANFWGKWDTKYYLEIAKTGYSSEKNAEGKTNYAFFPMYPLLIKLFTPLFAGKFFISALVISNISFLIACITLFELATSIYGKDSALRIIKYVFLLPTSFLFSAPLSESLFFALLCAVFYFANKRLWKASSILGFFLALTRPIGVLIWLPLLVEILDSKDSNRSKFWGIVWLTLIPIGLILFSIFNKSLTGDAFSFISIQVLWDRQITNPFYLLSMMFLFPNPYNTFIFYYSSIILLISAFYFKKLKPTYWILLILLIIVPLSTGPQSILRLSIPIFPLYFVMADIAKNKDFDYLLSISLSILQGALVVAWVSGSTLIV